MEAGVHVLWSAAGRSSHIVQGPFELGTAFDEEEFVRTLQAPEEVNYVAGEFPVVTLLIFSQYPAVGEVPDASSCSIEQSDEISVPYKDKTLMVQEASLMYRSELEYSTQPQQDRPRLYGSDSEWMENHVTPFFEAPCESNTYAIKDGGWFEAYGYLSIKSNFDDSARGYKSCDLAAEDTPSWSSGIGDWNSLSPYFVDDEMPDQRGGFRAFHLLRRQWACAQSNGGDYSNCEYSESETNRLAVAVTIKEMLRFQSTTWSCGAICGGSGDTPAFDLTMAEQVGYFCTFFDVMTSQNYLTSEEETLVQTTLRNMILLFVDTFNTYRWQLWNGNNWTPHLCAAALEWSITFWHEYNDVALEVLHAVNDIMWLHRDYYTADGVYKEGVAQYGYMSINGIFQMAALSQASFGFVPDAIDVDTIQLTANYFIASMSTDGYLNGFGDSWADRGWASSPFPVIMAGIAPAIINKETVSVSTINSSQNRFFSATAYGSGGFYSNPWRKHGAILQFDAISGGRDPPLHVAQPLGPSVLDIFPLGGYARYLIPLLDTSEATPICFSGDEDCIDASLPSLWDNIPYVSMSVQARDNSFSHSEVDFGTFIWSAWGTRLISEFGYGTISTSVSQWDMRRYNQIDNNPAGHNTVIIREAFQPGSDTVNFSQLNWVAGSLSSEITLLDGSSCVLMDGSEVYGASRTDGWLDMMKRYVCSLEGDLPGVTLIVDLIQTKANRESLSLYGSLYGGPDFDESEQAGAPHQSLTIDEYFYTNTDAELSISGDVASEILPFVRPGSLKWCSHVDVELLDESSRVALHPLCGIGAFRPSDGMGVISGMSLAANGQFVYDGLITAPGQWQPHSYKKRRFRFVTDQAVDHEGDVRVFVLSPSLASNPLQAPDDVGLSNCSNGHGCSSISPISCSCIQMCIGQTLKRVTIVDGSIDNIKNDASC